MTTMPSYRRKPVSIIQAWTPAFAGVTTLMLLALASPLFAESAAAQNKILAKVGFTQNLNAQVPLDLSFRDENGKPVHLGDYMTDKPVILSLVYFECPMLCTESLNGLVRSIRSLSLDAGRQYRIVTVSFDSREKPALAAAKKRVYTERYGRPSGAAGWAFLTGDEGPIRRLTDSVGFHFTYDPELQQFAHGTGIIVLTPGGKISRYLFGVEYSARDLRLALLEASDGKIGTPVDQLLLYCYHYDPMAGKYNLDILRAIRVAGLATVLLLGSTIGFWLYREKRTAAPPGC
jgi:protein SCO1/2